MKAAAVQLRLAVGRERDDTMKSPVTSWAHGFPEGPWPRARRHNEKPRDDDVTSWVTVPVCQACDSHGFLQPRTVASPYSFGNYIGLRSRISRWCDEPAITTILKHARAFAHTLLFLVAGVTPNPMNL